MVCTVCTWAVVFVHKVHMRGAQRRWGCAGEGASSAPARPYHLIDTRNPSSAHHITHHTPPNITHHHPPPPTTTHHYEPSPPTQGVCGGFEPVATYPLVHSVTSFTLKHGFAFACPCASLATSIHPLSRLME